MKIDEDLFRDTVQRFSGAGGGRLGKASREVTRWLESLRALPPPLFRFLISHSPKTEIWAGAGCIFDETTLMNCNIETPEALRDGLLIIGSAPNGDLVVLDLEKQLGAVGYVSHEEMCDVQNLRSVFVPVCQSIGEYISRINDEGELPIDYYEAINRQQ